MVTPAITGKSRLLIIVLYRTELDSAATWRSLISCADELHASDRVVLWDNSPQPLPEAQVQQAGNDLPCIINYHHTPENISLAAIYNRALVAYPDHDMLHILDQDSTFGPDYFKEIDTAKDRFKDVNLFLPLIWAGSLLISPGHYFWFKGKYWSAPKKGLVAARNNVAIASGMAIRCSYLRRFGSFEERLKLYGIDTNFMLRYARDNQFFYVFECGFQHDVAEHKEEKRQVKAKRFADFRRASLINAELFPLPVRWMARLFLWYRTLRF